jgi:hypothetical protein
VQVALIDSFSDRLGWHAQLAETVSHFDNTFVNLTNLHANFLQGTRFRLSSLIRGIKTRSPA